MRIYLIISLLFTAAFFQGCNFTDDSNPTKPAERQDLFTIQIGSYWLYMNEAVQFNSVLGNGPSIITVIDTMCVDDVIWYCVLEESRILYPNSRLSWHWANLQEGLFLLNYCDVQSPRPELEYKYPAQLAEIYLSKKYAETDSVRVVSINDTIITTGGTFSPCYCYQINTERQIWIKPGVGVVREKVLSGRGYDKTLIEFGIDNINTALPEQEILPLKLGNSWTYSTRTRTIRWAEDRNGPGDTTYQSNSKTINVTTSINWHSQKWYGVDGSFALPFWEISYRKIGNRKDGLFYLSINGSVGTENLILRYPGQKGDYWSVPDVDVRIVSTDASIITPSGTYQDCYQYYAFHIMGPTDTMSYKPGIGMVYSLGDFLFPPFWDDTYRVTSTNKLTSYFIR